MRHKVFVNEFAFSQCCLILHPHRVEVCFPPTFALPWRNSFVQIFGGTTLLKEKFGTTPQKRPNIDLNLGVGSTYGTNKPPLPNPLFLYDIGDYLVKDCLLPMVVGTTVRRSRGREGHALPSSTATEPRTGISPLPGSW